MLLNVKWYNCNIFIIDTETILNKNCEALKEQLRELRLTIAGRKNLMQERLRLHFGHENSVDDNDGNVSVYTDNLERKFVDFWWFEYSECYAVGGKIKKKTRQQWAVPRFRSSFIATA